MTTTILWELKVIYYKGAYAKTVERSGVRRVNLNDVTWYGSTSHGFLHQGRSGSSISGKGCAEALAGWHGIYGITYNCIGPIGKF